MSYIELEVPRAASASPQRQDTVEIGLLSDYDDLEAPSDDHSDILLVKLEGSSPGTPIALPGAGSYFLRNTKNIFLAAFLLVGGIFSVLFSQWLNYEKVAGKYIGCYFFSVEQLFLAVYKLRNSSF